MIPKSVITAWRRYGDWPFDDQVEQDLIISAALVKIFNNKFFGWKTGGKYHSKPVCGPLPNSNGQRFIR